MALIDLKLIGELALEGLSQKFTITTYCYNADNRRKYEPDSGLFVLLFKMAVQSENLFDHLKKLHQVCTDLAANNLDPYIDYHQALQEEYPTDEEDESPFSPFDEIAYCFDSGNVTDLPTSIEQYDELRQMAERFGKVQKVKREGLKKFFGNMTVSYLVKGEDGEQVVVPASELPEGTEERFAANREIKEVNVEYCLDGYNEFYRTCVMLLESHKPTGDYIGCATEILKLYAPYTAELSVKL